MDITPLRGTTSGDLLAIPAIMLGFHPHESCVVLGLGGARVEFCARMDLEWFTSCFAFGKVADQLTNAVAGCQGCSVAVLAYTADPEAGIIAIEELVGVLGRETVAEALVTDGHRFWYVHGDTLLPPEGVAYTYASSCLAAQAVYSGVNVTARREDAVAEVRAPIGMDVHTVGEAIRAANQAVAALDADARFALLEHRMVGSGPLGPAAAELAVLLQDEEHFSEVLAQLTSDSAEQFRPRLAEARRWSSDALAPNVLALLAMACWLDGEGAQQSECLSQLDALDPHHPLLKVLAALHQMAVPPNQWVG